MHAAFAAWNAGELGSTLSGPTPQKLRPRLTESGKFLMPWLRMHFANSTSWAVVTGDDPASGVLPGLELEHATTAKAITVRTAEIATIRRAGGRRRDQAARVLPVAPVPAWTAISLTRSAAFVIALSLVCS